MRHLGGEPPRHTAPHVRSLNGQLDSRRDPVTLLGNGTVLITGDLGDLGSAEIDNLST